MLCTAVEFVSPSDAYQAYRFFKACSFLRDNYEMDGLITSFLSYMDKGNIEAASLLLLCTMRWRFNNQPGFTQPQRFKSSVLERLMSRQFMDYLLSTPELASRYELHNTPCRPDSPYECFYDVRHRESGRNTSMVITHYSTVVPIYYD